MIVLNFSENRQYSSVLVNDFIFLYPRTLWLPEHLTQLKCVEYWSVGLAILYLCAIFCMLCHYIF